MKFGMRITIVCGQEKLLSNRILQLLIKSNINYINQKKNKIWDGLKNNKIVHIVMDMVM
jgi:hypothetical protein